MEDTFSDVKYLIFGTGALGSVFGGFLQEAGFNVHFYGLGRHYETILEQGITITGIWGDHYINPIAGYRSLDEIDELFDIILFSVKSTDTESAIQQAFPLLKPDGIIVSIQNGLNNVETIANYAGVDRTIGARVIFGVENPEPGSVRVTVYADKVLLGAPFGQVNETLLQLLSENLNTAQIPTEIVDNVMAFLWAKVMYNCALNPLGAILDVEYGKLGDDEHTCFIMKEIIRECFEVIIAKNVQVPYENYEDYFQFFLEKQLPPTYNHHSSMFQDLKAGRITEIDALNGAICKYGESFNIQTPYNSMITKLIKFKQSLNK